jgi:molecular chaperone DnaK
VPVHEKGRAEMLISDARQASKDETPLDRLRSLTAELQQVYQSLGVGAAGGSASPSGDGGDRDRGNRSSQDDDVIDAEFTTG